MPERLRGFTTRRYINPLYLCLTYTFYRSLNMTKISVFHRCYPPPVSFEGFAAAVSRRPAKVGPKNWSLWATA